MVGDDLMTGFDQLTYGFFGYPVSQAADIAFVGAHLVPVGKDQLPHIELARDIVKKFNGMFGTELVEPKALVGETYLTAIDGTVKMSKSLNNAIFLADEPEKIKKQVKLMLMNSGLNKPLYITFMGFKICLYPYRWTKEFLKFCFISY